MLCSKISCSFLLQKSEQYGKKFGAFQDWKILLCVEESKAGSFTRMLEAGGAKVLGTSPPFLNIADATHAFISKSADLIFTETYQLSSACHGSYKNFSFTFAVLKCAMKAVSTITIYPFLQVLVPL